MKKIEIKPGLPAPKGITMVVKTPWYTKQEAQVITNRGFNDFENYAMIQNPQKNVAFSVFKIK